MLNLYAHTSRMLELCTSHFSLKIFSNEAFLTLAPILCTQLDLPMFSCLLDFVPCMRDNVKELHKCMGQCLIFYHNPLT